VNSKKIMRHKCRYGGSKQLADWKYSHNKNKRSMFLLFL